MDGNSTWTRLIDTSFGLIELSHWFGLRWRFYIVKPHISDQFIRVPQFPTQNHIVGINVHYPYLDGERASKLWTSAFGFARYYHLALTLENFTAFTELYEVKCFEALATIDVRVWFNHVSAFSDFSSRFCHSTNTFGQFFWSIWKSYRRGQKRRSLTCVKQVTRGSHEGSPKWRKAWILSSSLTIPEELVLYCKLPCEFMHLGWIFLPNTAFALQVAHFRYLLFSQELLFNSQMMLPLAKISLLKDATLRNSVTLISSASCELVYVRRSKFCSIKSIKRWSWMVEKRIRSSLIGYANHPQLFTS